MQTLCLTDFDETLISVDSFKYMMIHEKWVFRPSVLLLGGWIALAAVFRVDRTRPRSRFKFRLLSLWNNLPEGRKKSYIEYFRSHINTELVSMIKSMKYDRITIVSASEESLIRRVVEGYIDSFEIIANKTDCIKYNGTYRLNAKNFITCYGQTKVERIKNRIGDLSEYMITVYTDSYSDKPLVDISGEVYMINNANGSIERII